MKILLINPRMPVYLRTPSLPLGLISIASYLKAHGHQIVFVERSLSKEESLKSVIDRFQPDLIGISTLSYQSSLDAKAITKKMHKWTNAPIIWGGPAPSTLPELYLKDGQPDFLILGEGEVTWLELAETFSKNGDVSEVKGLAYLKNGELVLTPLRPVADLSLFPDIDWSLVDPKAYHTSFFNCSKMLYLHASKGCYAGCTFCSNKIFHQGCNRSRDPKQIIRDIEYLVTQCGTDGIYFSDELFIPQRSLRNELLDLLIEKQLPLVWGCQMRIGILQEEDIRLMYRAGCRWILFGIESGNEKRIKEIKKGIDLSLAKQTVDWCKAAGITVQMSYIIGFPHERPEEMQDTIDFALRMQSNLVVMNILTAIPSSEIYDEALKTNPHFHAPETIRQIAKKERVATDQVTDNLSEIPSRDLHVAHFYFQWKGFIGKDSVKDDRFGVVKKMAKDTFNRIFKHGPKGFLFGTYHSAVQFLMVFFYSHCFPGILKKYHLKQ